jgi:hypothetical protein
MSAARNLAVASPDPALCPPVPAALAAAWERWSPGDRDRWVVAVVHYLGRGIEPCDAELAALEDVEVIEARREARWQHEQASEDGQAASPGGRPVVHPRACGGCGVLGLTLGGKGPCARCGWSKPPVERGAA